MADSSTRRINIWINGKEVQNNIFAIRNAITNLTQETAKLDIGSKKYIENTKKIKTLQGYLIQHNQQLRQTRTAWDKIKDSIKGLLPVISATAILGFIQNFGSKVFDVQKRFQTFGAVLKTALGSTGAAQASMKMIQDFAAKTPFSVEELTAAYVKLVNRGFRPTKEEMTKLGDLASSTGKSFDQLVEAILDAETGEFERLKEFGVRAQKHGEQIIFTFKDVKTTVDNNAVSIRNYLLSIGESEGVMGSMAAISETLAGKSSNLGDAWTNMLKTIGDGKTVFSTVIDQLTRLVNALNLAIKTPGQIKNEAEVESASGNVSESTNEINDSIKFWTDKGKSLAEARKLALDSYNKGRSQQLKQLQNEIVITDAMLKVYEKGINGFKAGRAMNTLLSRKDDLESRSRVLKSEIEQINVLFKKAVDPKVPIDITKNVSSSKNLRYCYL